MTQPVKYKGFGDFDKIVQETIRQFLPLEALTNSAATDKFFQKMMDDKQTWVKVAKQLNIEPKKPETAKNEVITRLRTNQRLIDFFEEAFGRDQSKLKKLDPIKQNNAIPKMLSEGIRYSQFYRHAGRASSAEQLFYDTLRRITEKSGTKEGVDPVDVEISRMFIQQGSAFFYKQELQFALNSVIGVRINPDNTSSYCPEHLVIFEELIKKLKDDPSIDDKEKIVKESLEYVWKNIDRFPRDTNYPYNFIEAALRSGIVRAESCFEEAIEYCPHDLWNKKEGSPITQLLKYATPEEKSRVLKQSQTWFTRWQNDLIKALTDRTNLQDGLYKCLHRVTQWPVFTAFVRGTEVNEKERQANIDWVNAQIDAAEAKAKDQKQYYDSIRATVQQLSKEAL